MFRLSSGPVLPTVLVACFLLMTCVGYARNFGRYQYDDAYITYRYAANLAIGNGLVFNVGERVNAASSPLFALLLAGFYRAGIHDLETVASVVGLGSGVLLLLILFYLVRACVDRPGMAFVFLLPLALSGSLAAWAMSGMETVFFMMLTALFLYGYLTDRFPFWLNVLVLALAPLARLEGLVLWATVLPLELFRCSRAREARRLWGLAAGLAPFVAYLLFCRGYYGSFLPQSYYFKTMTRYYVWRPQVSFDLWRWHARYYLIYVALSVAAVGFALSDLRRRPRSQPRVQVFLATYLAIGAALVTRGPYSDLHRYATFLLPPMAVASALTFLRILGAARMWPAVRTAALIAAATGMVGGALLNQRDSARFFAWASEYQIARSRLGQWLAQHTAPADGIASTDLGAMSYFALGRTFIDVGGLTAPSTVSLVRTHPERILPAFLARRPSVFADTEFDGVPRSEDILRFPHRWFVTDYRDPTVDLGSYYDRRRLWSNGVGRLRISAYQIVWKSAIIP